MHGRDTQQHMMGLISCQCHVEGFDRIYRNLEHDLETEKNQ